MHKDIRALNKKDPPPKGFKHPAYEVSGSGSRWSVSYLLDGNWNMSVRSFGSEAAALRHILDLLYYGDEQ